MPRTPIPPSLRWKVLARDGFRCRYCGAMGGDAVLVVDHVHPVVLGGRNNIDNLITACEPCNQGKGDGRYMNISDFQQRQEALDCVTGWLEHTWAAESDARWSPNEPTFLTIIQQAYDYAEAEQIVSGVGSRLRQGSFIAEASPEQICDVLLNLADWLNVSRGYADMHNEEYTEGHAAASWRNFWRDSDNTFGLLRRYPGDEYR